MPHSLGQQCSNQGTLSRWADHFAVYVAVIPCHRPRLALVLFNPADPRRTSDVFGGVAGGQVVAAWQIVVWQDFEIEGVVVALLGADRSRSFAARIAYKEMRTG
ncbi:hypothetical protein D3C84_1052630 [compost metagenome]